MFERIISDVSQYRTSLPHARRDTISFALSLNENAHVPTCYAEATLEDPVPERSGGFVYMIESPSSEDLLDGRTEGRVLLETLRLADVPSWYSLATTREMFEKSLNERLAQAVRDIPDKWPILHLSMHGNHDGIELSNGDFVSWGDLKSLLNDLMDAMAGGLLICVSSCFGTSAMRMAMQMDQSHTFWALVGNHKEAEWSDAAIAFSTFYHHFLKLRRTITDSVVAMKVASGDDNFQEYFGANLKNDWNAFMSKRETQRKTGIEALLGAQSLRNNHGV